MDAEGLAKGLGLEIHPLEEARDQPRLCALMDQTAGGVCVSLKIEGQWHLFLSDRADDARRRFAVAHELGHLLTEGPTRLLAPGVRGFVTGKSTGDLMDETEGTPDYAADIFAIRLLAPACVLHELHIDSPGAIAGLCGLPPRAAAFRGERMTLLNRRDAYYTSHLERQVRFRFRPVIQAHLYAGTSPGGRRVLPAAVPKPRKSEKEAPPKQSRLLILLILGGAAAGIGAFLLLR